MRLGTAPAERASGYASLLPNLSETDSQCDFGNDHAGWPGSPSSFFLNWLITTRRYSRSLPSAGLQNGALLRSDLLLGREGAILTFNRTEEAATGCLPLSISILKIEPNGELPRSVPAQTLWQNFRQGSEGARVADVRRWGGKVGAVEDVSECRFEAQLVMVVEDDSLRQPGVNV